jgi:hypothetical protein
MRWFDLKVWATCVLGLSACSDDGVPLLGGDTDAGTSAASGSASGDDDASAGGTSAVTTADPTASSSDTASTDTDDPTDPTGVTESGSSTSDSGTTGPGDSSGSDSDTDDTSGTTTGGMTEPECIVDEDCMLVNDCCSCDAIPLGDDPPECEIMECLVPTCTALGVGKPAVECNFGTCEVEDVSCDPMLVVCDQKPPACPKGQAPRVEDGCWGACIPVEYCDVVPSCEACGDDEACVEAVTQFGPSLQCVPIPPECGGAPSCDCLDDVCESPFDVCADGIGPETGSELSCTCPDC